MVLTDFSWWASVNRHQPEVAGIRIDRDWKSAAFEAENLL
jgi:exonuclease III